MLPIRALHLGQLAREGRAGASKSPRAFTSSFYNSRPISASRTTIRAYSSPSPTPPADDAEKKPAKLGIMGMFKQYGFPFLVWETVAWGGTFIVVYAGVSSYGGYEAVVPALKQMGIDRYVHIDSLDSQYGNIAIAFAINEALEIVRFPFVVSTTPAVANWWRSRRK